MGFRLKADTKPTGQLVQNVLVRGLCLLFREGVKLVELHTYGRRKEIW